MRIVILAMLMVASMLTASVAASVSFVLDHLNRLDDHTATVTGGISAIGFAASVVLALGIVGEWRERT